MPFLVLKHGVDKSKMFPNFNLEIGDDISDEEILSCVETIEKEKESVTSPPECRPQTLKNWQNASVHYSIARKKMAAVHFTIIPCELN